MRFLYLAQLLAKQPLLISYLNPNLNTFLLPLEKITIPINVFLPLWAKETSFQPAPLHTILDEATPLVWNRLQNSQPLHPNAYLKISHNFKRLIRNNSQVSQVSHPQLNLWRVLQVLQHHAPPSTVIITVVYLNGFFTFVWTETGLKPPLQGPLEASVTHPTDLKHLPPSMELYLQQTAFQSLPSERYLSPLFQGVHDFLETQETPSQISALDRIVHLVHT